METCWYQLEIVSVFYELLFGFVANHLDSYENASSIRKSPKEPH